MIEITKLIPEITIDTVLRILIRFSRIFPTLLSCLFFLLNSRSPFGLVIINHRPWQKKLDFFRPR